MRAAIEILRNADPDVLADADFEFGQLDELAFDPRAYDHNHPVNRRPNYLFGEWDPHVIDGRGRYRRFVVRQSVMDALLRAPTAGGATPVPWSRRPCWPGRCSWGPA